MSTPGSKKKGSKTGRGGARRPKAKAGGLPNRAEEFLDLLLPESHEQSGPADADRRTRRSTAHRMGMALSRAERAFDRIERALDEEEESREDRVWNDRSRRRLSDEDSRERSEDRADVRLDVWVDERRRSMRHRDVLLGLIVLTTLAAIALAYMAVANEQVAYAGVSILSTALSGVGLFFVRVAQGQEADGPGIPGEPPRFSWSVIELQPEVGPVPDGEDAEADAEPPG